MIFIRNSSNYKLLCISNFLFIIVTVKSKYLTLMTPGSKFQIYLKNGSLEHFSIRYLNAITFTRRTE